MTIPAKELKAAVKALNDAGLLDAKIKVVGVKKDAVVSAFTTGVMGLIEDGNQDEMPEAVIDFYNEHIAVEGDGDEEDDKKDDKKDDKPKERKPRSRSLPTNKTREASIVTALKKGGTAEAVIKAADEAYAKSGGGSNLSQSKKLFDRGVKYLYAADAVTIKDGKYKLSA